MTAAGKLADALLDWYGAVRRDLPWRRTTDPYAILVSEVMLQQTQVARVVPRYEAWLERWPTAAGARRRRRAPRSSRAWVGLGYNRRALALHAAAAVVARDGWPRATCARCPASAPYTAAAVASFAFGEQVAAVDTNVRRVAARLGRGAPGRAARPGAGGRLQPGDDGSRGDGLHGPRRRAARRCPAAAWCASAGRAGAAGPATPRPRAAARALRGHQPLGPRARRRRARGRPTACRPTSRQSAWRSRRAGLERDGLIRRAGEGFALG